MATSSCTPADGPRKKTIRSKVAYILEIAPQLHGNYNAIIAVYWKMFDDVESIDDLSKKKVTRVTSIDRAIRTVLNTQKLKETMEENKNG
jgi:hypothetical protein